MAQLSVRDLTVQYGPVVAVDGISFAAQEGEFVSLLGPSGCGKTTTLRCIAGLESASSGGACLELTPCPDSPMPVMPASVSIRTKQKRSTSNGSPLSRASRCLCDEVVESTRNVG